MDILIVGAGAIGGLLAAKLAAAGEQVRVVARGAHLEAIRERGLVLKEGEREIVARIAATDRIAGAGAADLVVLAVKAHQLTAIAPEVAAILKSATMLMTAQNGVPWWYFFKHGGAHEGARLESVDPGGVIAAHLPIGQVVASVIYPAAEIEAPGTVRFIEGNRWPVAELDGAKSERIGRVAQAFSNAGFKSPVLTDVRSEIWTKLWGNLAFNPISALTHAGLAEICGFPPTRALAAEMMAEAQAVGEAFGVRFRVSIERRIAGAESVGAHKTSMLQDVEQGRPIEIEALLGAPIELARMAGVRTPHLDAVYAVARLLGETLAGGRLAVTSG